MKLRANAALSLTQRHRIVWRVVEQGWSVSSAAAAAEVSERTCSKWVARYRSEREAGLLDRSSTPVIVANRTEERRIEAIAALRRLRFSRPEIAEVLAMAASTVSGILTRIGMGRLGRLGLEPAERYQRQRPGELIHIDVKKLGRIERGAGHRVTGKRRGNPTRTDGSGVRRRQVGWECVHVAIDDCTRFGYAEVLADEMTATVVGFLRRAVAFYRRHGITVETLMTDNGSAYRSTVHAIACRGMGIRHLRTRPYTPQTNGKAERFIHTHHEPDRRARTATARGGRQGGRGTLWRDGRHRRSIPAGLRTEVGHAATGRQRRWEQWPQRRGSRQWRSYIVSRKPCLIS